MEYTSALIKFLTTKFETEEEKETELIRLRFLSYESKEKRIAFMHMRHLQMTGIPVNFDLQASFDALPKK